MLSAGRRAVLLLQRRALPRQLEARSLPPADDAGGAVDGEGPGAEERAEAES